MADLPADGIEAAAQELHRVCTWTGHHVEVRGGQLARCPRMSFYRDLAARVLAAAVPHLRAARPVYTLEQVRDGTGWPTGSRFVHIMTSDSSEGEQDG